MKKKSYTLVDCEKQNKEHLDTFHIPPARHNLEPGTLVKLIFEPVPVESFGGERMWVKVKGPHKKSAEIYEGILDNNPVVINKLKCGDVVLLKGRHVANIMKVKTTPKLQELSTA